MPDRATYVGQAASIYDPQLEAEKKAAAFKRDTTLTGLGEEEKTVEPAYQKALRGVGAQVREGEGRITQLYNSRLQGQFSGLQANDTGMMYAKANQLRGDIETERAQKLSNIASRRTLAQGQYATDEASLTGKYTGLKNQYTESTFNAAQEAEARAAVEREKMEREDAYRREQLNLGYARIAQGGQKDTASQFKVSYKKNNAGYMFNGPNGQPVSMYQYAEATGNSMLDLLRSSPTKYDRDAYNLALKLDKQGKSEDEILGTLKSKYSKLF